MLGRTAGSWLPRAVGVVQSRGKGSWVTPLSGNELHCLDLVGMRNENLAFGNSVRSLGVVRNMISSLSSRAGGRNTQITEMIRKGRATAFQKMVEEVKARGSHGVVGVSTKIGPISSLVEFSSYGGAVAMLDQSEAPQDVFSASCSGEQLYCLKKSGFSPKKVVFGNEAYSAGVVGVVSAMVRRMVSGEVSSFSSIFNTARSNALARLREDAFANGCNFVSGVRMNAVRLPFVQEVAFYGTGCTHPDLPAPSSPDDVITSALPEEELWSLLAIGKRPIAVITGCSVYNLGIGRSVSASLQQIKGGEASRYTELTAAARNMAMKQVKKQAEAVGADDVVSVRILFEELQPGMIEFFAFGTAVKNDGSLAVCGKQLPPQVLLGGRKPFYESTNLRRTRGSFGTASVAGHADTAESQSQFLSNSFSNFFALIRRLFSTILSALLTVFPFLGRMMVRAASSSTKK